IELQAIGFGLAQREAEVGLAHRASLRLQIAARLPPRCLQSHPEAVEGGGTHGGEDLVLVAEITVRGHGAAAEGVGELPHAHAVTAGGGELVLGYRAEPRAKGVDVGRREVLGHALRRPAAARGGTPARTCRSARGAGRRPRACAGGTGWCRAPARPRRSAAARIREGSRAWPCPPRRRWRAPRRRRSPCSARAPWARR